MQRSVAMLVSCALLFAGCSRTMSKVGIGAGLGVVGIGVLMKAGALGHGGETDPEDVAFIPISGGLLYALVSTLMLLHADDDEPAASEAPAPASAPVSDPDAEGRRPDPRTPQQLAAQATAAARAGDCRTALRLTDKVRPLDADRHAALVRSADIARCLAALPEPAAIP